MDTKYTKGNWYVKFMDEKDPNSDFWVKSNENSKVCYGTDIMCDDYGEHNGYPREQRLADAKLIAAAPDLLEALLEARRMYETIEPAGGWQGVYEQIGNAIRKAVG